MEFSSEGYKVSEIEDLSKRLERLGRNSTENYTPVDSRCLSGQTSNLENGTFSSADKSTQHHGNDKVLIPYKRTPLYLRRNECMNQSKIRGVVADDIISYRDGRASLLIDILEHKRKINEGKFYTTSGYEWNLKNPSEVVLWSTKSLFRGNCKWKPYHKLTEYERRDHLHIRRAIASNRLWMINHRKKVLECCNINGNKDKVDNIKTGEK